MKQVTKWRPWQFGLRSLLLLTAVIAVGAAFFGWRARQLEPQRRAVARIVALRGSVEFERRGWIEAIWRGCETEEAVSVTLPGHLANEAAKPLSKLNGLRFVRFEFSKVLVSVIEGVESYKYIISNKGVEYDPTTCVGGIRRQLPDITVEVVEDELPSGFVYYEDARVIP